jgi:hypothetical protein
MLPPGKRGQSPVSPPSLPLRRPTDRERAHAADDHSGDGWHGRMLLPAQRAVKQNQVPVPYSDAAREARKARRNKSAREPLTNWKEASTIQTVGETDAGTAGEQPARDNRPGCRQDAETGAATHRSRLPLEPLADSPGCLKKTPGSGAEPQVVTVSRPRDCEGLAGVPESLISEPRLSNSR